MPEAFFLSALRFPFLVDVSSSPRSSLLPSFQHARRTLRFALSGQRPLPRRQGLQVLPVTAWRHFQRINRCGGGRCLGQGIYLDVSV